MAMTHWEHLSRQVDNLSKKYILDLGCGRGGFLIDIAKHGGHAVGLELSQEYIQTAYASAAEAGVSISIVQGVAEQLPFPDDSFDFINICEVIEHVENPERMLSEVRRILKNKGDVYMSVPNRFGVRDPHFHLYFVNWMPRIFSDFFIGLFGKHKNYEDIHIGHQRLSEMHYYTFAGICSVVMRIGLRPIDIRAHRIEREFTGIKRMLARAIYPFARGLYFDSFHLLLKKL